MTRARLTRQDYRYFASYPTRWRDNDVYGQMNNAVFYEYVDTLVNGWLIERGGLAVPDGPVVCLVAETGCVFHASLGFFCVDRATRRPVPVPEPLRAALAALHTESG